MFTKLRAFTMAEAILVMTILGIIATIMISTLKPAEYKEKSMQIMAKKVLSELDVATTQILMNDTVDGTINTLIDPDTGAVSTKTMVDLSKTLGTIYKKYLTSIRKTPESNIFGYDKFMLKDGAAISVMLMRIPCSGTGTLKDTIFPGETNVVPETYACGSIVFDINDNEGPNVLGKDRFCLPLGKYGIQYAE